jgi:hypothetical protein
MAIDATDWTVTRSTGVIAYIGDDHDGASPSYATVIEFHRWLQGLADDAVSVGDDELDITNTDPSRRSTDNIITLINGYTIGDTEAEHLYDGSIIYDDGDEIYDGIVNFGNSDAQIQIIQNGAVLTDDWWNHRDGVKGDGGLNYDDAAGISHRFMIKTRTGGADVDGRRLIGTSRRLGYTYSEFSINGTSRGNNVLALSDSDDRNNNTAAGTLATWDQFVNDTSGYNGMDVDNNGANEYYYSRWDNDAGSTPAVPTINDFYEYCKYITRDGSGSTMYGISGELFRGITHEIEVDNPSGTFSAYEAVSWSGGTGQMLAIDSTTAPTKMWIQLLTGVAPTDGQTITGGTSSATCDVDTTVTDRSATISTPFVGASTGSAIVGAYGVGIDVSDLTSSDKVKDLGNNDITPPNYVTNTVAGLVSGEDRVLVAPWDGSSTDTNGDPAIDKDQLSLDTTLSADNITSVVVSEAIPSDTPSEGYIRVTDDDGFERRLHYSSWDTSTFTIDTTDGNEDFNSVNATSGNDVYIAYIDELASGSTATFTSVQSGSRDLVVIVRDGAATPIKQFISSWSQGTAAQTITAIRTTDA